MWKKISVKEFLASTHGTMGTPQAGTPQGVRWPCKPIILSIRHFESPTAVQLNSW